MKLQEHRFRHLLRYAYQNSEYYRDLYGGIDLDRCRLTDIPILTKSAMMDNFDRFVTDRRIKFRDIQTWLGDGENIGKLYLDEFLPILTSGSTGEPAVIVYHRNALDLIHASLFARHPLHTKTSIYAYTKKLLSHLLGGKMRFVAIVTPNGNIVPVVRSAPSFLRYFVKIKTLALFDPIEEIVAALNEFQPNYLMTLSFFIAILAQEQLTGNLSIEFDHPGACLSGAGEPLNEEIKRLALKAWNKEIQDNYGAAECYFMATSCYEYGRLHAMNDLCIIEVVDGDHNPVPQGEYGEKILVTNLTNFVQPIIRCEIEDVVGYADQICGCGSPFPTLLPVRGRTSDFLYFKKPNGGYERVHPYRFLIPLFYVDGLQHYQIVQTTRNELTFLYVSHKDAEGIEQQLWQILQNSLKKAGLESQINLRLERVEKILRNHRSGKYQAIKSLGPPINVEGELDKKTY